VAGILVVVAAAAAIALMAPRSEAAKSSAAAVWSAVASTTSTATASVVATPDPTPAFASFRGLQLHLPIAPTSITVVAFHQSSYNDTYVLKPLIKMKTLTQAASAAAAARKQHSETVEPMAEPLCNDKGIWAGWGVQVWRSDVAGRIDTAIDCGAKPGTPVIAPVSGMVMRIRPYKLYGRINDFEFNIKPDGWDDVDVIVLHVTDPVVKEGDRIVGGVTRIASVRKLSTVLGDLQLRTYTTEGGNHTHVQLNVITKPNATWVVGKDPPGLKRLGP
jgi:murein DD-endopeptidase MepM/ murein hydrolase activator NlpD